VTVSAQAAAMRISMAVIVTGLNLTGEVRTVLVLMMVLQTEVVQME
jgi:hypothetical protein